MAREVEEDPVLENLLEAQRSYVAFLTGARRGEDSVESILRAQEAVSRAVGEVARRRAEVRGQAGADGATATVRPRALDGAVGGRPTTDRDARRRLLGA